MRMQKKRDTTCEDLLATSKLKDCLRKQNKHVNGWKAKISTHCWNFLDLKRINISFVVITPYTGP